MHRIAVVGGGVSGLGAALALARQGNRVTVIERDSTPMPASADEAFAWERHGAPQVRHSHAFLARLVRLLRSSYPDIYDALIAEGASPMPFGVDIPPTITDFSPEPDDDELTMLACRRTTFEWVLRRAALAEGNVTFLTGNAAVGLLAADRPTADAPVTITGVRLADGSSVEADLVVAAGGRRSAAADWLVDVGAPAVPDEQEDTGIVYFSRFFRLRDGAEYPPRNGPIGGDLGYLKYGVFVGDNRTFSVTLATPVADGELRRMLSDPATFDRCAGSLPATAPYLDGRAEPIGDDVHVMAGLLNRWRDYVVGGEPVALGLLPVGDAVLCTNPLYGRGCSTGFWGAQLLADAVGSTGLDDLRGLALAYDASLRDELLPWYRSTVQQDAEARRVAEKHLAGEDPDEDTTDPRTFIRGVFRDGLLPALRSDAVVLRAFFRTFNLLTQPDALITNPEVSGRVLAVWQDRDNRPPEPVLGPKHRRELLELIAA